MLTADPSRHPIRKVNYSLHIEQLKHVNEIFTLCEGIDADGSVREALWQEMEKQVNEAAAKL